MFLAQDSICMDLVPGNKSANLAWRVRYLTLGVIKPSWWKNSPGRTPKVVGTLRVPLYLMFRAGDCGRFSTLKMGEQREEYDDPTETPQAGKFSDGQIGNRGTACLLAPSL